VRFEAFAPQDLCSQESMQKLMHTTHTPFHDMLPHNRVINEDVISPNVLT